MNWPLLEKAKQDFLKRQSCDSERPRLTPRAHPYPKPLHQRNAPSADDPGAEQSDDAHDADGSGFGPTARVLHDFDVELRSCHDESRRLALAREQRALRQPRSAGPTNAAANARARRLSKSAVRRISRRRH